MKKLYTLIIIATVIAGAAKQSQAQNATWLANGNGTVYTLRKVGININSPSEQLDVNGRAKFRGNAYFDSLLTAFTVMCDALYVQNDATIKGSAHISKNAHVVGVLTVGSTLVPCPKCGPGSGGSGTLAFDGIKGSIISSSGKIDFDGNELKTTGRIISDFATISKQLTAGNITIQTNNNGNGSIISSSGKIDFDSNDLITTGNISSSNISTLTSDVSNLQSAISNLQPTQWTSNPDSSISFAGNVFVKNLNATEGVSIGNFRFTNGGTLPVPVIRDTIRSPYEIVVKSGAEKLSLAANQVEAQQQLGVGKTPGAGVALDVNGNIQASGTISSSSLSAGSIQTSQLTINGGSVRADTLRANNSLTVNHSLLLAKENTNSFAEVSTIDTSVSLVLQNSPGSAVGIGITPSIGEKLSVAGNVGVSGNLRLSNLSSTSDNFVIADASGNLKTVSGSFLSSLLYPQIPPSTLMPCNTPPAPNPMWFGQTSIVSPYVSKLFTDPCVWVGVGNVPTMPLDVQGNALVRGDVIINGSNLHVDANGNVGIGTTNPGAKLEVTSTGGTSGIVVTSAGGNAITATNANGGIAVVGIASTGAGGSFSSTSGFGLLVPSGMVAIGSNYVPPGYKMSIEGALICEDVTVQLRGNWPDFVYGKEYKLTTLMERKNLVFQYQRMPYMKSAQDIVKKGNNLSETVTGLTQNLEEHDLYLFDHDERIEKIEKENAQLKIELDILKKEIESLKKK